MTKKLIIDCVARSLSRWGEGWGEGVGIRILDRESAPSPGARVVRAIARRRRPLPKGRGELGWALRVEWAHMRSGAVGLARGLRRSETAAEHALWAKLRSRQIDGWKFKRQVPFGRYVLDFFCFDARLAIEVDGDTHGEGDEIASDKERESFLSENGVRVCDYGMAMYATTSKACLR